MRPPLEIFCPTCGIGPFANIRSLSDHEFKDHPEQFEKRLERAARPLFFLALMYCLDPAGMERALRKAAA